MSDNHEKYTITDTGKFGTYALIAGVLGLALSALGAIVDLSRFYHAYLTAFAFWTSLGLGGLFFVMLHHLSGATWSVVLRRISENLALTVPLTGLFFLPLLFGLHDLYHWTHTEVVAEDAILQGKAGYLNQTFFVIRTVVYFIIWSVLARVLYKMSLAQDKGEGSNHVYRMRRVSAIGMVAYALTVSFAGFDWLMSLDPHWYSTIFGVYYFAGGFLGALAFITIISRGLRKSVLSDVLTGEHFHDLGKLMLGFTIFWTYVAFSQYFLIWYGNIPEETIWFLHRWEGSWMWVSLVLIFGHFAIPFVILLFRNLKYNFRAMKIVGLWLLVMHWVDMYWLVLPTYSGSEHGAHFSWMDIATTLGIGGIFLWYFMRLLHSQPVLPVNDPELEESKNFVNV